MRFYKAEPSPKKFSIKCSWSFCAYKKFGKSKLIVIVHKVFNLTFIIQ